jgi:glycosyltransferase involved in cell wall biosynthesis
MIYPRAFVSTKRRAVESLLHVGRWTAQVFNRIMPGKLRAETLLVANGRTGDALPSGVRGRVLKLVENGVDLTLWSPKQPVGTDDANRPIRFVFSGRLVEWKGVDQLLKAFAQIANKTDANLDIIGDGDERQALVARAEELKLTDRVKFLGWMAQSDCATEFRKADVFVLPSLFECGGAVVLEAMASGLPVIATDWGGPADYLDGSCGILVPPNSRQGFVDGLANAMLALAGDPVRRRRMGEAGRERVVREYDWQRKIDRILEVYRETAGLPPIAAEQPRPKLEVVVRSAPRRRRATQTQVPTTK